MRLATVGDDWAMGWLSSGSTVDHVRVEGTVAAPAGGEVATMATRVGASTEATQVEAASMRAVVDRRRKMGGHRFRTIYARLGAPTVIVISGCRRQAPVKQGG